MLKKLLLVSILVILLAVTLGISCGQSTPTPTPKSSPTPLTSPTPATNPSSSPSPSPSPAKPTMQPMTVLYNAGWAKSNEPFGRATEWFGQQVEKDTNGLLKFKYVWTFGMTKPGEELDSVKTGESAFANAALGYYPTKLFLNGITRAVPFSTNDVSKFADIMEELYYRDTILSSEFEKLGAKFLWAELAPSNTIDSTYAVTKLEDFKGMKLALTGEYPSKAMEAVGAVPLPITLVDRGTSLQTGMIQGTILPTLINYNFKLHEFAKHFMDMDWGCWNGGAALISLDLYNKLPKDVQDIIVKRGKEANRLYIQLTLEDEAKAKEDMKSKGVTFHDPLSWEDKVKWAGLAGEPLAKWIKQGEDLGLPARQLMEKYIALTKATGHKFPKEWSLN